MIWSWFWPALRVVVARLASIAGAPAMQPAPIPVHRGGTRRSLRRRTPEA